MRDLFFESVTMMDFKIRNPLSMMDSNFEFVIVEWFRISNPLTMTDSNFESVNNDRFVFWICHYDGFRNSKSKDYDGLEFRIHHRWRISNFKSVNNDGFRISNPSTMTDLNFESVIASTMTDLSIKFINYDGLQNSKSINSDGFEFRKLVGFKSPIHWSQ